MIRGGCWACDVREFAPASWQETLKQPETQQRLGELEPFDPKKPNDIEATWPPKRKR